jgi:ABC-type branched-subunit amino acid transport system substrate-binding protein
VTKLIAIFSFLLPLLAASAVCVQADEVVKIGFASPLSGPQGHYGRDNHNGAQLAIDELKHEHTTDKDFDFRAQLTLLRSVNPQAVFFAGYDAQAGPLARQMRELDIRAPLLGGETMNTAKFLQLAGPAAEGHIASTPGAVLMQRPGGRGFSER